MAGLTALCVVWLLGIVRVAGQAPAQEKPVLSDEFFKNIQVLKGIPVDEFLDTMGMFAASTGLNCTDCHIPESGGSWARYADDNQLKRTTRGMVALVNNINRTNFGGRPVLTCYSCHNGNRRPRVIPSLAVQYTVEPVIDDPYEILPAGGAPSADAVLDKYIRAVGGAARLASVTSVTAKGSYRGFDDFEMYPLDIFAKAPNQRATILHTQYGDQTTTYDGRSGWVAAPAETKPQPVMALTGSNLEGAALDAELVFPGQIKQVLGAGLVVGPLTVIGDTDVRIVQAKKASGLPIKLYFEEESGLLARVVRYSESPVGRVPTQIDYSDYRDVAGVKIPFKWTSTWTDGRTVFELSSVQVNAGVPATRFAKPTPPAPAAPR
jgi:photosynthetic reaction center cytochrome c subunit